MNRGSVDYKFRPAFAAENAVLWERMPKNGSATRQIEEPSEPKKMRDANVRAIDCRQKRQTPLASAGAPTSGVVTCLI
jgi:hypothetical protein